MDIHVPCRINVNDFSELLFSLLFFILSSLLDGLAIQLGTNILGAWRLSYNLCL